MKAEFSPTGKLIITIRTWGDVPKETQIWVSPTDPDWNQANEWAKAKGLL
jgi:hypothetical protein